MVYCISTLLRRSLVDRKSKIQMLLSFSSSSSSAFPARSVKFTTLGEIFAYVTAFYPTMQVLMVHAVFGPGFHLSRTLLSGSFEFVQWNTFMHILNHGSYSHPKELWGMESGVMLTSKNPHNRTAVLQDREHSALPTELFWPRCFS